ncbi:Dfp1/Him1, central region-domain-containing protein [Gymnopilus junonius]|uniref:Dfp1/Him1, central region-domain-containing protein n=1 Tax=Gymnopilus junonius TaxID=109634 RepID=A0A9P5TMH8_GYMJU|nr:Dfp1/Him1, central region-domain-containing protein [Gymnopilus junonius]
MATFQPPRRPLANRSVQPHASYLSPTKSHRTVSGSKRPHSPDRQDVFSNLTTKRARAAPHGPSTQAPRDLQKERRHMVREQREEEFKDKYKRAFPDWTFCFDSVDVSSSIVQTFKARILQLGGHVDDFFSSNITHLITDVSIPSNLEHDKENKQYLKPTTKNSSILKSPIKLAGCTTEAPVVNKAVDFHMKIWTSSKIDSVLSRCLELPELKTAAINRLPGTSSAPQRALSRLLQTEKFYGTTERDPTQKRHDYHYFSRGSCFVLLEDMHQQLATIAAHEYPIIKDKDNSSKKPWPVLHCHPLARNPFIPFDEKEKKRYERLQLAKEGEAEQYPHKLEIEAVKRKQEARNHEKPGGDSLRRVVSMSNFKRRLSHPVGGKHDGPCIDLNDDGDDIESAKASGYLASGAGTGYLAASGNSVSITSTTGTTSTSGQVRRNLPLPPALAVQIKQQVRTSRKLVPKDKETSIDKPGLMGPPSTIPNKQPVLKKSKSTNTLKLPKREEGAKPGYCESCRAKFSDFSTHTESKKHRKFASNPVNFQALDEVLNRVRRQTRNEVKKEEAEETVDLFHRCKRNRHFRPDVEGRHHELSSP